MRYLITGGSGFIGSHLSERLLNEGHGVLVLDDLSTGRYENVAPLEGRPGFELRVGSVTEPGLVEECVKECQAVFHLASAVGVRLVVEQPVKTIETIVNGTDVVLRASADIAARCSSPQRAKSMARVKRSHLPKAMTA